MQQKHTHHAYMHILCQTVIVLHLGHILWPYHDTRENKKLQGKVFCNAILGSQPWHKHYISVKKSVITSTAP